MQTNFKENSEFFQRIMQIIDYKGIKNVNIFATQYLKYDAPQKINRLKKQDTNPSYEIIQDIVNTFEEIDANWLITGKGQMLKKENVEKNIPENVAAEPQKLYDADGWKHKYDALHQKYTALLEKHTALLTNKLEEIIKDKRAI